MYNRYCEAEIVQMERGTREREGGRKEGVKEGSNGNKAL